MMFLISLFYYFKFKGIKTVLTVHNRISHEGTNLKVKSKLIKFLLRNCDYLIVHAKEGIGFAREFSGRDDLKIIFRHHPVTNEFLPASPDKVIDILIWGRISPYKGIDKFLELLYDKRMENRFLQSINWKMNPVMLLKRHIRLLQKGEKLS